MGMVWVRLGLRCMESRACMVEVCPCLAMRLLVRKYKWPTIMMAEP